mmetsp:Transcript_85421/g.138525  ORF Transcript_85421/g.138525 Transcript_85421/m.138525 type:complete len:156 (+) Transcript_85421:463-930(+)
MNFVESFAMVCVRAGGASGAEPVTNQRLGAFSTVVMFLGCTWLPSAEGRVGAEGIREKEEREEEEGGLKVPTSSSSLLPPPPLPPPTPSLSLLLTGLHACMYVYAYTHTLKGTPEYTRIILFGGGVNGCQMQGFIVNRYRRTLVSGLYIHMEATK